MMETFSEYVTRTPYSRNYGLRKYETIELALAGAKKEVTDRGYEVDEPVFNKYIKEKLPRRRLKPGQELRVMIPLKDEGQELDLTVTHLPKPPNPNLPYELVAMVFSAIRKNK